MTRKFSSSEIIKILDALIGTTTAVGETRADERTLDNLRTLIDVTNWCIDGIYQSSETMGRPEWSMHQIGYIANCSLAEFRDWLQEALARRGDEE